MSIRYERLNQFLLIYTLMGIFKETVTVYIDDRCIGSCNTLNNLTKCMFQIKQKI